MRWLLGLWFMPISILTGWLGLASQDLSFGLFFLTRDFYDLVFGVYAQTLGVPAESLPPLVVRALVLDSTIVMGLYALRRRKAIVALSKHAYARFAPSPRSSSVESLSSAP
ncbi:DUF6105 family protein [Aureimonas sp. AU40]|uniref:DUF6105 family protein n=1 Tax=Aureimonas sp. AU40 TaxID=1637747 RepID=UPI0007852094|nr:DUF6105 family protein [Aureimonas sp. AU40]